MSAPSTSEPQTSRGARAAFWPLASLGIIASIVAWSWYGFAQFEAQTEQGKALSAGTTMAGFAEVVGGIPLVVAHLLGLALLLALGWKGYRERGIAFALVAVAVASAIGVVVAQLLWAGQLFQLGINNITYVP